MDGFMDGWVGVKPVLRIAYSNQKLTLWGGERRFFLHDGGGILKTTSFSSGNGPSDFPPPQC